LVTLWLLDTNLNYVTQKYFGPYYGWEAESLSPDTNGNSWIRVIWRETKGIVAVWFVDQNLTLQFDPGFGPFFGYDPGTASAAVKSPASGKAAAGMVTNAVSPQPFPVKAK
ncbi:MAG: hypothetical protein ACREDM_16715, partial [Methylocella sp.]